MFEFINDIGNYTSRKVDCYNDGKLFISTARVSDGSQPYETAIEHPEYNGGTMIIVEAYDSADEAQSGHERWHKLMTGDDLPEFLQDCQNSALSQFLPSEDMRHPRKRLS
jgi:hypothetical protein